MSTPKKLLGTPGAIEQPRKWSGGPFKVDSLVRAWRGPKEAIYALLAQIKTTGFDWTLEEQGPNATLTTSAPSIDAPEVPVDTWELLPSAVEKDLLEADVPIVNRLDGDEVDNVRRFVEERSIPGGGVLGDDVTTLYRLMIKGMRSVRIFAPTLRRTRTVTSQYAVVQSNANVGRLLATGSLIATEAVPASFLISLNSFPFTATDPHPSDGVALSYGWFKDPPSLQVAANARLQIIQEWHFGLWPTVIYLAVI